MAKNPWDDLPDAEPTAPAASANPWDSLPDAESALHAIGRTINANPMGPLAGIGEVGAPIVKNIVKGIGESIISPATAIGSKMEENSLAKSAASLPVPNVKELRAKGLNNKAISNIIRGYQATHEDIRGMKESAGETTQDRAIEAAATIPSYLIGGPESLALGKMAIGAVGKAALHGAAAGATYGEVRGGMDAMNKAIAEGKGAGEVFNAGVGGIVHEGAVNAGWGAVLGGLLGKATGGKTAARELAAKQALNTARRVSLENFAEKFQGSQMLDRYKHALDPAASPQDMAVKIISDMYPDLATSEDGLKAAATLTTKIQRFMNASPELRAPSAIEPHPTGAPEQGPGLGRELGLVNQQPAVPTPEPHVVGNMQVERPAVFAPPAGAPTSPELADRMHIPPPDQMAVGQIAPTEGLPGPAVSAPLGPVETGGRPQLPAPEVAPRLEGAPPTQGIRPEPMPPSEVPGIVAANEQAMARSGTPEEQAALAALKSGAKGAPAEGLAKQIAAIEPRPVEAPSNAPEAVAKRMQELGNPSGTPGTRYHGDVEYRVSAEPGEKGVTLHYIRNNGGEKGAATEVLKKLTAEADLAGIPMELDASPLPQKKGGKIPLPKLIDFYKKHGFEVVEQSGEHATMRRQPVPKNPVTPEVASVLKEQGPAIAERVKGVDQAQALSAAGNVVEGQPLIKGRAGDALAAKFNQWEAAANKRLEKNIGRLSSGVDPELMKDMIIVTAAKMYRLGLRSTRALTDALVQQYGEAIREHIPALRAKAQAMLEKLIAFDKPTIKQINELKASFEEGKHGMEWYDKTREWLDQHFGDDAEMMARFMAATSYGTSTEANALLALRAYAQWKLGLPFEGMKSPAQVQSLLKATRGEVFGDGKAQGYLGALLGDPNALALDRHVMRILGFKNAGKASGRSALKQTSYRLYAALLRDLASERGVTPRQYQAALWHTGKMRVLQEAEKAGEKKAAGSTGSFRPMEFNTAKQLGGLSPKAWVEKNKVTFEKLRGASEGARIAKEQGGYTFDPHTFETYNKPGYIVTLDTKVIPDGEATGSKLITFASRYKPLISRHKGVTIGLFRMDPEHMSMDFNIQLPDDPANLEKALKMGFKNRQKEIGHIDADGNFTGHKTGYDPEVHGPQFTGRKIADIRKLMEAGKQLNMGI